MEQVPATKRRRWTDQAGFLVCMAFAAVAVVRAPRATLLVLLPSVLLDVLSGVAFLIRRPLRRQSEGLLEHFAAYTASYVISVFLIFAKTFAPSWLVMSGTPVLKFAGLLLWIVGASLAAFCVWRLRYAFSIVPQARELVTTGPYRLARHPIYACYIIQGIGYCLVYANLSIMVLQFAWLGLILVRTRFEERLLQATFPQYAEYCAQVGMFWPRLRVHRPAAAAQASERQAA
jgi:protein-S-isoprenylcysteine O-methyltransferase Ste14